MQKIEDFLKEHKTSKTAFANNIGITYPHLCGVLSGKFKISLKLAKNIERVTDGKITAVELLQLK